MDKKSLFKSMAAGLLILCLVLVSTIISTFKTGIGAVVDTALLSVCLMKLFGALSEKTVALSDSFARAFISCASTIALYFAVLFLNDTEIGIETCLAFTFLMIVSSALGILFFSAVGDIFSEKRYTFPQLAPRLAMISAAESDRKKNLRMAFFVGISAVYAVAVDVFRALPAQLLFLKNSTIYFFDNSLLYVATGYFIGYQTWIKMAVGFAYSLLIFVLFPAGDFSEHLMNPWLYSVILAFSLTNGVLAAGRAFGRWKGSFGGGKKGRNPVTAMVSSGKRGALWLAVLFAVYAVFFGIWRPGEWMLVWSFLLLIPVTVVSSMSTAIGVAETGFWFSALDDIVPILLILLVHMQDSVAILLVLTGLTAFEMAGIYYVLNCRVVQRFSVEKGTLTAFSVVSCVVGSVLTIWLVVILAKGNAIGGAELPVPNSKVLSMTIEGLITTLSKFRLPEYLNLPVFVTACVVSIVIRRFHLSPMTVIAGMLLPFGAFVSIGVGALVSWGMRRHGEKRMEVFSGLAIGESLVSAVMALMNLFSVS